MTKGKSSKKSETKSEVPTPRKSKSPIVATCSQCKGKTVDTSEVYTKSEAMDLCWHKDGCPGGHDDRQFKFS